MLFGSRKLKKALKEVNLLLSTDVKDRGFGPVAPQPAQKQAHVPAPPDVALTSKSVAKVRQHGPPANSLWEDFEFLSEYPEARGDDAVPAAPRQVAAEPRLNEDAAHFDLRTYSVCTRSSTDTATFYTSKT